VHTSTTENEILTPLDMMRQQATEGYEQMRKWVDEHGEEIIAEDKKREEQLLGEQKMSLLGFMGRFGGGEQPPPPSQQQQGDNKK
jgi:hypothetical protein